MIKSDVIIIGAGPAGSTCAWQLQRHKVNCILLDRQTFPRDKLCAGWITPKVVKDLEINLTEYPFSLTSFSRLKINVSGIPFKIPTKQYAIRRYEFDHWLQKRSGAPLFSHEVKNIKQTSNGYNIDGRYLCQYLVGAGGTYCPVYKSLFQKVNPRIDDALIVSLEEEFLYDYYDETCQLWFLEQGLPGYAWYVPKQTGYVNIGIGAIQKKLSNAHDHLKKHWHHFCEKLVDLSLIKDHKFHPKGYAYYIRQGKATVQIGNAFLIGDSAGLATTDMGEGIRPAVHSALLAADAIISGKSYTIDSIRSFSFIPDYLANFLKFIFSKLSS